MCNTCDEWDLFVEEILSKCNMINTKSDKGLSSRNFPTWDYSLFDSRLHSPHVLLGYERTRQPHAAAAKDVVAGVGGKGKDATYVNLYLTIEPPLKVIS